MANPGHVEGEGSAGDKFRVSGTQETVEGAGANKVSGVLSEASCCRCGAPLIKKSSREPMCLGAMSGGVCDARWTQIGAIARADVPWRHLEWHMTRSVECLFAPHPTIDRLFDSVPHSVQIRSILFLRLSENHLEPAIIDDQVVS